MVFLGLFFPVQRYMWYILRNTVQLGHGENRKMHLGTRVFTECVAGQIFTLSVIFSCTEALDMAELVV